MNDIWVLMLLTIHSVINKEKIDLLLNESVNEIHSNYSEMSTNDNSEKVCTNSFFRFTNGVFSLDSRCLLPEIPEDHLLEIPDLSNLYYLLLKITLMTQSTY